VTRDVDQQPAPFEPRLIADVDCGDAAFVDELPKGLRAVEQPARIGRLDANLAWRDA